MRPPRFELWLALFLSVAGSVFADGATSPGPSTRSPVSQHDVIPILLLHCTVCHGGRVAEGDLDLRTKASMLRGGKSGPAIVPGAPDKSLLIQRVQAEEMPPRKRLVEAMIKPLDSSEVATIRLWIEQGAPEVPGEEVGVEAPMTSARDLWSFQPPRQLPVPKCDPACANPVDAFIGNKLREHNLSASRPADRLVLLRRASYDLTGLPPEEAERERFLADERPGAWERLIDRLLASPRYGERWARDWLDLAGYADCEGRREQHLPRPFAWRYRDYVIRAFNADKPFDRFLLEQLAGDELADYVHCGKITQEIEDNLVATGFLRMAPDPTWANLTGFVPDRLEVIADALDVLGSGVMGLTFKCARCHDHKFDPITQRDYYRLAAIFKGAYDEHDWLKPEINGFGGAVSVGLGERYLPYVTTAERQRWERRVAEIQSEIERLKSGEPTVDSAKRIKELEASRPAEPRIMALWDRGQPSPTYVYRRGNYLTPGALVAPGLPVTLARETPAFRASPPWPGATSSGRRLAFARWLTATNHPLTARVMMNRVWQHHFGRGLVATPGNFGKTGEPPSHPELLDWLACEFMNQKWSVKAMQRIIMTSETYRQSSRIDPRNEQLDPSNRWLSRMPMRRLTAEELRDTLLWLAGELDETRFGPPEAVAVRADGLVTAGKRRSIYVQQLRKEPVSLLESFDFPNMNPNCLWRSESLVAPQALHLLNDRAVRDWSRAFGRRVRARVGQDFRDQVQGAYGLAVGRPPSGEELAACLSTMEALRSESRRIPADEEQALMILCHTLMNTAAFLYVD